MIKLRTFCLYVIDVKDIYTFTWFVKLILLKSQLLMYNKSELFYLRLKMDKENLLKQSSTVTNQLLSVSRQLANTSQQSLDTLETLCK